MRGAAALAALLLLAAGAAAAPADPPLPPPAPTRAEPPPPPEQVLPPYEDHLERLAELLGILSVMRTVCGEAAGPDWRAKMADLVEAEGVTDARRERLAGSFNRGYESYRLTYRACTPAARTVIERSLVEGSKLSGTLSRLFSFD